MKIAVTGGNGFLGREVLAELKKRGHSMKVLSRSGGRSSEGIEQLQGSIDSDKAVDALMNGCDVLVHLAGKVSRDPDDAVDLHRIHVQGTRRILEGAKRAGISRVVLASTSGTVGVNRSGATVYDDATYPLDIISRWPYYLSKTYQEKLAIDYCSRHNLELFSLRPSLLLGPGDVDRSSTSDVENFINKKIPSRLNGGVSFVDVRDTAAAFAAAVEKKNPIEPVRTYLLGGANYSLDQFFRMLEELSGVKAPPMKVNNDLAVWSAKLWQQVPSIARGLLDMDPVSVEMAGYYWYIDSSRAEEELGFRPRPPEVTLRDTIDWLRSAGKKKKAV